MTGSDNTIRDEILKSCQNSNAVYECIRSYSINSVKNNPNNTPAAVHIDNINQTQNLLKKVTSIAQLKHIPIQKNVCQPFLKD